MNEESVCKMERLRRYLKSKKYQAITGTRQKSTRL